MIEKRSSHKLVISIFLIFFGIVGLFISFDSFKPLFYFLPLLIVGLYLFFDSVINKSNANKYYTIATIFAALAGIGAFIFIGFQVIQLKSSVDLQRKQIEAQVNEFKLERRPYLYLHLPSDKVYVQQNVEERTWYGGGNLRFRNVGKDPATITDTDYMVASDVAGIVDLVGWFERAYGGFPDVKTVFPAQEDAAVPCHPVIASGNKKPKLFYIGAVISYVGPTSDRIFWYKFSQLFIIEFKELRDRKGNVFEKPVLHPHKPDHDWDRNTGSRPPDLKEPDWEDLMSQSYIKTLTK